MTRHPRLWFCAGWITGWLACWIVISNWRVLPGLF